MFEVPFFVFGLLSFAKFMKISTPKVYAPDTLTVHIEEVMSSREMGCSTDIPRSSMMINAE